MNEQKAPNGIEWTRVYGRRGFTWNVVGGCKHACQWEMPDGEIAECYAKTVAERVAQAAYPEGFDHHYWHPERLHEPLRMTEPAGIFLDSMSDLMGAWVKDEQIEQVLDVCRRADHHIFMLLTKNAPRLKKFTFPHNVWVGVSSPPDWMFGKPLRPMAKKRMLHAALKNLSEVNAAVRWMSFEPLSSRVDHIVQQHPGVLQWAVIGAASNGRTHYPPRESDFNGLVRVLDAQGVPVFFKGNLRSLPAAAADWREDFPAMKMIASATPLPTIIVESPQAVNNGLEADLITITREYADLSDAHARVVNENKVLKAAIRNFLRLQISVNRDRLYDLIGEVPPHRLQARLNEGSELR